MKVRGRWLFADEIDCALIGAGLPHRRVATVMHEAPDGPAAVVFLEGGAAVDAELAYRIASRRAEGAVVRIACVPKGTIKRTTSGKIARQRMLQEAADSTEPEPRTVK